MSFLKNHRSMIIIILGFIAAALAIMLDLFNIATEYVFILHIIMIVCFGYIYLKNKKK